MDEVSGRENMITEWTPLAVRTVISCFRVAPRLGNDALREGVRQKVPERQRR